MALGWRKEYLRYRGFFLNIVDLYKQRRDLLMFLEILLSCATIAIFSIFALKPTAITIIELVKEINSKEEVVSKMDTKLADLRKAQTNYSKEAVKIQILDTAIPTKPSPETFLRQVQGIAYLDTANINSASIDEVTLIGESRLKSKSDKESLPSGAQGLSFYFNFNGNYVSLSSFLSDFEYMRRPVKIESLKISKQLGDELTSDLLDLSISGQAPYIMAEEESIK
jgi:hypothetical protein